ncbi:MAG: porin [Dongiaceae bacterium]
MMKRVLLGSSALLAAGLATNPAFADEGIKLSLGGFMRTAVEANFDDHEAGDLGNKRYNDGVFSDGEVYFVGKTKLDSGLSVGARVELEAEQANDQIDAAFVYFQGGFGEVRVGSLSGALGGLCVTPVGGTANFGAFTQNQTITNANFGVPNNRPFICRSVDGSLGSDKSQKIMYITPNFGGFQLAVSWTPNGNHESAEVTDFHSGMPVVQNGEQRNVVDAYALFTRNFDGWGVQWGGGGSWATSLGGDPTDTQKKGANYQSGLNVNIGNFSVGAGFEYELNGIQKSTYDDDFYIAGGGVSYKFDAFTAGLQYSHNEGDYTNEGVNRQTNTVALTGNYALGPGINLDGTVQYTWSDGDKGDAAHGGYQSVGLGLGTAFNF